MMASAQPRKRIKVTFPQPLFEQLAADVPARKRSAFIVAATEEALRRRLRELKSNSPLDQDMTDILRRFENDELAETLELAEWIGEYRLLQRLKEKTEALRGVRFTS